MTGSPKTPDQHERFVETAKRLGCDEDKNRFEVKLGAIARRKSDGQPLKEKRPGKEAEPQSE